MSDVIPNADAIRAAGCDLHAESRDAMREVMRLASAVRSRNTQAVTELCSALEKLEAAVKRHEVEEHRVLDPFLAQVDSWGAERIDRIDHERRVELQIVSMKFAALDATELLRTTYDLVSHLVRALRNEERESFSRDVLRNEWIPIHQEDG